MVITRKDGTSKTYKSQSEAARCEGKDQATISKLCLGKLKSINGFSASFVRECTDATKFNDDGTSDVCDNVFED